MHVRAQAGLAGMVAVALALGVTELAASLVDGVPSLVTSVGTFIVPVTPPAVESWAIRTFGTSDKAVLAFGTVVITLGVGAMAGWLGLRRRADALTLLVVFMAIGGVAALMQPLVSGLPTALVVVGVGTGTWVLLRTALDLLADGYPSAVADSDEPTVTPGDPLRPPVARRSFLGLVGGAGVAAAATAAGARGLSSPAPVAIDATDLPTPTRALPPPSSAASFDIEGLAPIHVPNEDFYLIDTALSVPRIDASTWTLRVTGMVDRELELTFDDLLAMSAVERDVTIACVSNEVGGDLVGNARWLGVRLREVLEQAGVQDGATQVVGRSVDGWTGGFPTEAVFDGREPLIAYGMNGDPLPASHGYPARLIVPGLYGYVSATKWLTEIELTTWEDFDGYWVPRGWAKEGPIKTQSRIDVPRAGASVAPGEVVVAGVAWAPTRGIDLVEIRVDGGAWLPCVLSDPLSHEAWVQWTRTVDVAPGDHRVEVRATDGTGHTQSEPRVSPRPDGAEGWHTIRVRA